MRPAVEVARIAGASRHSRLETEPILRHGQCDCRVKYGLRNNGNLKWKVLSFTEQGKGFKPSAEPLYPNMDQVPPDMWCYVVFWDVLVLLVLEPTD